MAGKLKDLTNKTFGKWKVLKYNGFYYKSGHKRHNWLCECQCIYKTIKNVEHSQLLCNESNSCNRCINKKYNTYDLTGDCGIGYTSKEEGFFFDLEDYYKIKDFCWHKHEDGYLRTKIGEDESGKNIYIFLHNLILEYDDTIYEVDHKDRKPQNNRKNNLIIVTHNENMKNYGIYENNTSGIIGVSYNKNENAWVAYVQFNKVRYNLGTYADKNNAIISRLIKERELYKSINKKPPQEHLFKEYNIV